MKNVVKYLKTILVICLIVIIICSTAACLEIGYVNGRFVGTDELREIRAQNAQSGTEDAGEEEENEDSSQQPALYEDIEGGAASAQPSSQASKDPAAPVEDDQGDVVKPDGSYVWTQKFVESNNASTPAITAETAVIVIGSDGRGTLNEFIPCRMNGDELFIEYPWGDKGNTSTSGSLKITTINGKKHLEGDVRTSNPDGFYVIDHWIMDEK